MERSTIRNIESECEVDIERLRERAMGLEFSLRWSILKLIELYERKQQMTPQEVHGRWIEKGYKSCMAYCSECLHRAPRNNHGEMLLSNYCYFCGAKMDGGDDNTN